MNIQELTAAVESGAAAFRINARMQPVGGVGTPVYPATYGDAPGQQKDSGNGRTKYAVEGPKAPIGTPIKEIHEWKTVLLQSVAQGARWMSRALEEHISDSDVKLPIFEMDFTEPSDEDGNHDLADLGVLTTLGVPHRVYDAILRDSLLDGTLFRYSDIGQAITEARPGNATALFQYAPTVLLFGGWDSTGPKGGLGSKFERAIYSEIVACDIRLGVKVKSRIDPLEIEKDAATIYEAADAEENWVSDVAYAKKENNKPKLKGKENKKGKPSAINHGNIPPSLDSVAGGVIMDHAVHTCVLSLGTLRKLRFATYPDGSAVARENAKKVNTAVRTVIAALGLVAITARMEGDFDLRSRCNLVNEGPWQLELIGKHAEDITIVDLSLADAIGLLEAALAQAEALNMTWHKEPIALKPADKLLGLVRASREQWKTIKVNEGDA